MFFSVPNFLLRRTDSFGSPKCQRGLNCGKGGMLLGGSMVEGNKKIYSFCGFLGLEIILVIFLFSNRDAFVLHKCVPAQQIAESRYPPSAWYYEHIYEYPIPVLNILSVQDGAPPLRSRIFPRNREITIATHTTPEKLPAVKMTALRWSGAMAVVVLVRLRSEIPEVYKALRELHAVVEGEGRCRLNIQVVIEPGFKDDDEALRALYPINSMRNLAVRMVTTELVFVIDADFVPNPGLHEHLTQDEDKYERYVRRATVQQNVLVVPSFSMIQDKSIAYRESLHALPHTKEEMREAWWNGILECFHCDVFPPAHYPTDYQRFVDTTIDYPYKVTYQEGYEPFFITALDHLPGYDGRFRGYGKNKVSHTYLLAAMGTGFTVIPEGFLVELPHLPSFSQRAHSGKNKDPMQKWRTDALYRRFKAEVNSRLNVTDISTVPLAEDA